MRALAFLLAAVSFSATARAECGNELPSARAHLKALQVAKEPSKKREQQARDAWAQVAPECRPGTWYVTAANLLRFGSEEPLTAGTMKIASPKEALEAGLAACPKDADLLAYVAYVARIAPASAPALPPTACDTVTVEAGDTKAYVCGVQAFTAGRFADARSELVKIKSTGFPDLAELFGVIKKKTKKSVPKVKPPSLSCDPFCPAETWRTPPK